MNFNTAEFAHRFGIERRDARIEMDAVDEQALHAFVLAHGLERRSQLKFRSVQRCGLLTQDPEESGTKRIEAVDAELKRTGFQVPLHEFLRIPLVLRPL